MKTKTLKDASETTQEYFDNIKATILNQFQIKHEIKKTTCQRF